MKKLICLFKGHLPNMLLGNTDLININFVSGGKYTINICKRCLSLFVVKVEE